MKDNFNKYIIRIILATFALVAIVQLLFIGSRSFLESKSYIPIDSDKLLIGIPEVVDIQDVKTNQLSKSDNSTYTQIKVKNISNETLYHITINLEDPNKKESMNSLDSFRLSMIEPGEEALLTTQINLQDNLQPTVANYSYRDDKNNLFEISMADNKNKMVVTNFEAYFHHNKNLLFKELSPDIQKLSISDVRNITDGNDNYIEVDIKNISDDSIYNVCITFEEVYNNIIIGNYYEGNISKLESNEERTLRVKSNKDLQLNLISYGYTLMENQENKEHNKKAVSASYDVYPNQAKYMIYKVDPNADTESIDNIDRGLIISVTGLKIGIWCALLYIIKRFFNKKIENGIDVMDTLKKIKIVKILNWILISLFIFIIILICIIL